MRLLWNLTSNHHHLVLRLLAFSVMAKGAHANGTRARLPSCNVEARTLAAEVSDGAAALQMNVDIANSTTVVVLEHFHL
jgi:hypothetical protein